MAGKVTTETKLKLRLERIEKAVQRARSGNLRSVGYLISTLAKGSIRNSQQKSQPGQPPTTRRGLLRRAIRYELAQDRQSVVIGPAFSIAATAGEPHEHGGLYKGEQYEQRPFMGPALEEALPQIGPGYKIT